jgi:hypothetical protein
MESHLKYLLVAALILLLIVSFGFVIPAMISAPSSGLVVGGFLLSVFVIYIVFMVYKSL